MVWALEVPEMAPTDRNDGSPNTLEISCTSPIKRRHTTPSRLRRLADKPYPFSDANNLLSKCFDGFEETVFATAGFPKTLDLANRVHALAFGETDLMSSDKWNAQIPQSTSFCGFTDVTDSLGEDDI